MRRSSNRPTDAELEILRVLWDRGPSTVREIHGILNQTKPAGYTTVLKLTQIMVEKALVRRNEVEFQRAHVYQASVPKEETQRQLVGDLVGRAFDGSASELVMRALSNKRTTPQELEDIRKLLDDYERGTK
ncbi:MAG: BlaI/MecI/CopY family transcriptional regulator [Bryobacteraceae bacterium]|jgi:predicted transcriptional regulator